MTSNKMALLRFLGGGIVAYLVLLVFFWIFPPFGNPLVEPRRPLQPSDLPAIEEAIGLDLPDINTVKNMALWHGKDTTLYAKLEVSEEEGGKLLEVVKCRAEPYDPWPISSPEPMAAWFRPPSGGDVAGAFDDPNGIRILFCAPRDGRLVILLYTDTRGFPTAFWDIFTD